MDTECKITIVIDNITKNELCSEWGLSIWIDYRGTRILLDTGSTNAYLSNLQSLHLNVKDVDYAVLSHAHYDHANGFPEFLKENDHAVLFVSHNCTENCYDHKKLLPGYIGIPKGMLKKYKDRIVYAKDQQEIFPGGFVLGHSTEGLDALGKRNQLFIRKGLHLIPDGFDHEQSLILKTKKGLVIFNSCSHGGADVVIKEAVKAFPEEKVYALIGGFHLYKTSEENVRALAKRIRETGIQNIVTGHCTGDKAFAILKEELGDIVQQMYSGMELEV